MANHESRRSIGLFALLYIPAIIAGGWYLWAHLKPAFDSINAEEPATEQPAHPTETK